MQILPSRPPRRQTRVTNGTLNYSVQTKHVCIGGAVLGASPGGSAPLPSSILCSAIAASAMTELDQSWTDFVFRVLLLPRGSSCCDCPPDFSLSSSLSLCHSVHVRHASGPHQSIDPGQQFTWEHSNLEVNKPKNRYANVIAYDHSRVILAPIEGKADPPASDMSSGLSIWEISIFLNQFKSLGV